MQFTYGLEDRPPWAEMLLFGLQWFAVAIPIIIIIGKITGGFHSGDPGDQIIYLQKLTFVMAVALLCQILLGHRLPLITGPATVLLIGVIASRGYDHNTIYSAILFGGALLTLLSITGLFGHLQRLFTTRVIAVVLLLIAFTLSPVILGLITGAGAGGTPPFNLIFALILTTGMFISHRALRGIWKATLIVWAMTLGSLVYFLMVPESVNLSSCLQAGLVSGFFRQGLTGFSFDAGVMISFLFCVVALSVNDLGSIHSMNEMLKPADTSRRITRGMLVTGLANMASGLLGVIGPVNYSLSPGVITSTGCASRFPLLPAAFLLFVLSFSPAVIGFIGSVPPVVIGSVLIYILSAQIAAGLIILAESGEEIHFTGGLIIGLPILLGTIIAFLPVEIINTFPPVLRPVLGNGFVVGVAAALVLEHGVFKK
jgi:xanthine/uracil permease